jgi:hypothetical protein
VVVSVRLAGKTIARLVARIARLAGKTIARLARKTIARLVARIARQAASIKQVFTPIRCV